MTNQYAADTSVSVERTRAELETLLGRFGADAFGYMTEAGKAMIQFRCKSRYVRVILPLPSPSEKRFHVTPTGRDRRGSALASELAWEQACRSAWRALFLAVKAKLVAVDQQISTFDNEFMAQIVLPNGKTVSEEITPAIQDAYATGKMSRFTLALPAPNQ